MYGHGPGPCFVFWLDKVNGRVMNGMPPISLVGITADMCNPLTLWLSIEIEILDWLPNLIRYQLWICCWHCINWNLILGKFLSDTCDSNTKDLIKCLKNVSTFLGNGRKMKVWKLLTVLICGYKFINRGFWNFVC